MDTPTILTNMMALVNKRLGPGQKKPVLYTPVQKSRHQASKPNYQHKKTIIDVKPLDRRAHIPTQHERVLAGRAFRKGIKVEEYTKIFPKGFDRRVAAAQLLEKLLPNNQVVTK